MAKIAEDTDFNNLKGLVDNHQGWILELNKADTKVWTKPIEGCSFQMVKIYTVFPDISSEILYDVLHDPDYRKVWDTHMLESLEIGLLNVNNDVGYYASKRDIIFEKNPIFNKFSGFLRFRFAHHQQAHINFQFLCFVSSVMSASPEATRLCATTILVGYRR